jgi:inorganic pyrophosphatase
MSFKKVQPFKKDHIQVVIETPKGSRNKYAYDPDLDVMVFKHALPEGHTFPFDFGFIPQTKAEDGDPLDVLVIMDSPSVNGCMIECRVIGAILAEEKKSKKKKVRNDRVLAVPLESETLSDVRSLKDVNPHMLQQIEHFFISYNKEHDKKFKPLKKLNPEKTIELIKKSIVK